MAKRKQRQRQRLAEAVQKVLTTREIVNTVCRSALARKTGISKSHVSKILNGRRSPSREYAEALALAIGITRDQLWDEVDRMRRVREKRGKPVR